MKHNPIKINDYLQHEENKNFKNLITAVSYEDRGYFSVQVILKHLNIDKVVLICFEKKYMDVQMDSKWEKQKQKLINLFDDYGIKYEELECNPVYFNKSIDEINNIVKNKFPNVINITTLPKNYIIRLAKEYDFEDNIFLYFRSTYRKPTKKELTIGIEKIIPIDGFEGFRKLTAEDLLVLILGYEGHRALSFLSKFSPNRILPLISIPNENDIERNNEFYQDVIQCNWSLLRKHSVLKKSDNSFFNISSFNHLNFANEFEDTINKFKRNDVDVCISPLGTKPQTLGIYLYWKEHKDCQIIYSVPIKRFDITNSSLTINDEYPVQITEKTDNELEENIWIYKLPQTKK